METTNKFANIYAVKDELTNTFMQPIFIKGKNNMEQATRLFAYQVNNTPIWKDNPSDYSLFHLGNFDEETGLISAMTPVKVANGRSVWNGNLQSIKNTEE